MSTAAEDVVPFDQGGSEPVRLTDAAHRTLLDDVMRGLADIAPAEWRMPIRPSPGYNKGWRTGRSVDATVSTVLRYAHS